MSLSWLSRNLSNLSPEYSFVISIFFIMPL
jgi:hypothetical protein